MESMIIRASCGSLEGIRTAFGTEYLGIPFARPPLGDLAFRAPLPADTWKGVRQANRPGHNPLQWKGLLNPQDTSQDCLYLNVFVPEHKEEETLPVMVWIYGGSWASGGAGRRLDSSSQLEYEPGKLSAEGHVIVVTFNYRLNAFAGLALSALSERFDSDLALRDQLAALSWVQENISAFGGDPANVTLFGQSAGAASILALLSMEKARPLFAKTILQSGCYDHFWTAAEARENTVRFLKLLHIREDHPEDLLEKTEKDILKAAHRAAHMLYPKGEIRCFYAPVINGELLPDLPARIFDTAKPMLAGTCRDEADAIARHIPGLFHPAARRILRLCAPGRLSSLLTEKIYREPMKAVLSRMKGNAFAYEYDLVLPSLASHGLGAFHATEIPVLFGWDNPQLFAGAEKKVEETGHLMRKIWGQFAWTGNPGWQPYCTGSDVFHIGQ